MRTIRHIHYRVRMVLLQRQCDRLLARINRQGTRVANPGYDELSCPWFLGVMAASVLVLFIDIQDAWPAVVAAISRVAGA